jgi:hypothetical protein
MARQPKLTPGALAVLLLPKRYQLNQQALIQSLLPSLLRQPRHLAWLEVLLSPLLTLYEQFADHMATTTRELSYNGQTMLLEKALNDRFDPAFRRIRIINADTELEPVYLNFVSEEQNMSIVHFANEGQPLLYVSQWIDYTNQVGFTVRVPRGLAAQEDVLQARIKQLKLALVRHTILYF